MSDREPQWLWPVDPSEVSERTVHREPEYNEIPAWCDDHLTGLQVEKLMPRMKWVVLIGRKAPVSSQAKQLAYYIHSRLGENTAVWTSVSTMATENALSQNTIRKSLRILNANGWLHIEYRCKASSWENDTNAYTPTWPTEDVVLHPYDTGRGR